MLYNTDKPWSTSSCDTYLILVYSCENNEIYFGSWSLSESGSLQALAALMSEAKLSQRVQGLRPGSPARGLGPGPGSESDVLYNIS